MLVLWCTDQLHKELSECSDLPPLTRTPLPLLQQDLTLHSSSIGQARLTSLPAKLFHLQLLALQHLQLTQQLR